MAREITPQQNRSVASTNGDANRTAMAFTPAVDIFERDDTTVIVADMPGVAPDDVDVALERQILTLRGKVKPYAPEGYRRLSSEYREGDYIRVFTLSDDIDQSKINAEFKNGVLRLELPRSAQTKPRKISVKAA
ncbi:Molecular chaperone IbpA, HSP20 family [Jannaschia faecimaris]|uniref:Molecular chaperone IbpA, HSP20 family n=1 Tax=Jannaschia faecimaris TaxID=1244108 RepID=A0A1H3Q192_9RHOB|nr:Hsp20/alpha crystallin family protein [Jannaschia faecimaris]SDZ06971.1 Molecular chaperone IbpA, HSP20 family [Jannaschia faecimaris]